jgi:Plasmid encoded RepA protein
MTSDERRVMTKKRGDRQDLTHVGAFLKEVPNLKPLSQIQKRLVDAAAKSAGYDDPQAILYQHTVLCQTGMPYRDPGNDARSWERLNGTVHLKIVAGDAMHPEKGRLLPVGLPFGPKARLILMHINQRALVAQSPEIEIQDSLTKFVRRILHLDTGGRTMNTVKDQLTRLSASSIRLGVVKDGRAVTVNSQIISAFELWTPRDDRQRILWPSTVCLSLDYFESLKNHAVPLDEAHIAALSHNALALDIYAWLAQRLHRVSAGKSAFVPWAQLHRQFGWHYKRIRAFRNAFKTALTQVHAVYPAARFDLDSRGILLWSSPTPVSGRLQLISGKA